MLKAGTAITDISPPPGIELAGYPHYLRHNTGIHDPLYASALYLENGKQNVLLMAMDLLFFSKKYVQAVRDQIAQKLPIAPDHIFISVSHTHSGPWAAGRIDQESLERGLDVDPHYMAGLKRKLADLAAAAYADVFWASLGTGTTICGKEQGIGGNRRDPEGSSDPRVWLLAVKDRREALRAAVVKASLHPTVIHEDSTLVTADSPAYVRQVFREAAPEATVLFMQGTAGNQSTRYFRKGQDFAEAERIGRTLGEAAYTALDNISFTSDASLGAYSESVDLPLKKMPSQAEAKAWAKQTKRQWQRLKEQGAPYIQVQNANLKNLGAENTLGYVRLKEKKIPIALEVDELPAQVQVLALGDTRMVGLPGEIFVEFGLEIEKKSPFEKTMVVSLANGCLPGYVCTRQAVKQGGYEAGASMLDAGAGSQLVEVALRLLKRSARGRTP